MLPHNPEHIKSTHTKPSPISHTPVSLPAEIIQLILSHLSIFDRTSLASCTLVNKSFNQIATPLLWRRLCGLPPVHENSTPRKDRSKSGRDLLALVKIYHMNSHPSGQCDPVTAKPFELPNLETIRLFLSKDYKNTFINRAEPSFHFPSKGKRFRLRECHAIKNLRPKAIVYKEIAPEPAFCIDQVQLASPIWSEVETLIFLIPPIGAGSHYVNSNNLSRFLPKLKRVFWIFDPTQVDLNSSLEYPDDMVDE